MGFNLSWIAVEGRSTQAVLDQLGLVPIGEASCEMFADYACAELANGWLIVTAARGKSAFEMSVERVSTDGLALLGEQLDVVSYCRLSAFQGGQSIWSVARDPERDRTGLLITGAPPPLLDELISHVLAKQAKDPESDYLSEAPLELCHRLCDYMPGWDAAPVWTVLSKVGAGGGQRRVPPGLSVSRAMEAELVPLLKTLGWDIEGDLQRVASPSGFFRASREAGGCTQVMHFEFKQAKQTYLTIVFVVWDGSNDSPILSGRGAPDRRSPLKRLLDLAKGSPAREDSVAVVIRDAREEIMAIDRFLKTGERGPRIQVEGGLAKDAWPNWPRS